MSFLSRILGGDRNDAGADAYKAATANYGQLGQIGAAYGQQATNAAANYAPDNSAYRGEFDRYINGLRQDPYTSAYGSAQVQKAMQGSDYAYQHNAANILSRGAASGQSMGNSAVTGALQANDIAHAGQYANAQNGVATRAIDQKAARDNQILALLQGRANADYSQMNNAYGQQGQIASNLGGIYQNIGNQQQEAEAQRQQAFSQLLTQGASLAGNYFGMRGGAGRAAGGGNGYDAPYFGGGMTYTGLARPGMQSFPVQLPDQETLPIGY